MDQTKNQNDTLDTIEDNMAVIYDGDKVMAIPAHIRHAFKPGDAIRIVDATNAVLHIPKDIRSVVSASTKKAAAAFMQMGQVTNTQISDFFHSFAAHLSNDEIWSKIQATNNADIALAKSRGRSTTRLIATEKMRKTMIEGLLLQASSKSVRGDVIETIPHEGWSVNCIKEALGVIGFVFEGRPNVVADATGVLRGGNSVVLRIGRDALQSANCIMETALDPALKDAGLPDGSVTLINHESHAAGWSLFTDPNLSLAVARGSGEAVKTLGALAQQSGIPVSLHGTGGAWLIADETADPEILKSVVTHSLDRKVCNTLNVLCLVKETAPQLLPHVIAGIKQASVSGQYRVHGVKENTNILSDIPGILWIEEKELATEWEWETCVELSIVVVDTLEDGIRLCNQYSPQFIGSLISNDTTRQDQFYQQVNAPFIGNGFTRWADGQYALNCPELGLSNWENGRLFARSAILNGNSVFSIRTRMTQSDWTLHR